MEVPSFNPDFSFHPTLSRTKNSTDGENLPISQLMRKPTLPMSKAQEISSNLSFNPSKTDQGRPRWLFLKDSMR